MSIFPIVWYDYYCEDVSTRYAVLSWRGNAFILLVMNTRWWDGIWQGFLHLSGLYTSNLSQDIPSFSIFVLTSEGPFPNVSECMPSMYRNRVRVPISWWCIGVAQIARKGYAVIFYNVDSDCIFPVISRNQCMTAVFLGPSHHLSRFAKVLNKAVYTLVDPKVTKVSSNLVTSWLHNSPSRYHHWEAEKPLCWNRFKLCQVKFTFMILIVW